ncbi:TonB-dependent receptor [Elizabethkingia meningoseptica]|uniref:TonB-dependent receptor plug domain-containing protein n=1 Tax=Elizabethkingia meningoseptica TaxID=238 RepID=UPI0023B176C3|nr:TonB-dependent receptor plug domain-containing protein [Elizabethkingia meningoseptica]MDE5436494.1 TonB-dependent receptor [Elizabethkingia meningoseptica]MDE5508306.1 TonB-dependent receptor [Elizabethkingia meningoseptica]MDE5514996.1 TonB-dependent receptor [Elizabethkingia meningoseptica]MDE5525732.1 TonB-dependent receptor [Elizabethkingia meningoseptica]MDE5529262.1 TonB-dependent receptor [Elizabethkingia meningoseptica]
MNKKLFVIGALLIIGSNVYAQEEKSSQIEEVTIASKRPQELYKTGKKVTLISAKDLEKYKGQSLSDVLDQVSGFQITGNFNNASEPKIMRIRGGKSANVVILLDGVPLRDVTGNDYTASDLRLMALESVESIEVLNGASSVLYGSNATVSVINIKTKKSTQKAIEGALAARAGSYSTFAQDATVRGKIDKFNYQVNAFNEKSQGISSAKGDDSFDKDGWEKQNLSAGVGYSGENFDVNINSGWNHNLYLYDTGAFTDGKNRGNDKQYYVGGNANFRYRNGKVVLNTRYTDVDRLGQTIKGDAYQDQFSYKGKNFLTELYNNYKVNDYFNFTVGVQYEDQKMSSKTLPFGKDTMEEVLKSDDTKLHSFDAYANFNLNYNGFNLDAGARMTDNSKFGNHWVYSVNPYYIKEVNDMYFKVGYSFATAFIAPTLYQNYGSLPWTLPNHDLKPEKNQSHEIDLGFGKKDRSLNFTVSLFQRKEKDAFAYVTNPDYTGIFQNIDDNKVKGFEVGFDYQIIDMVKLGGNYSFVEKEKEATMLRQPKQRVNSYVEVKPFAATRIVLSHQFVGKRNDAYYDSASFSTKNVTVADFNLFNLNINQNITHNIDAYLNIGNLFNKDYVDVIGYTTKNRNFTLGVSYRF